jgi:hypothetical protein
MLSPGRLVAVLGMLSPADDAVKGELVGPREVQRVLPTSRPEGKTSDFVNVRGHLDSRLGARSSVGAKIEPHDR